MCKSPRAKIYSELHWNVMFNVLKVPPIILETFIQLDTLIQNTDRTCRSCSKRDLHHICRHATFQRVAVHLKNIQKNWNLVWPRQRKNHTVTSGARYILAIGSFSPSIHNRFSCRRLSAITTKDEKATFTCLIVLVQASVSLLITQRGWKI